MKRCIDCRKQIFRTSLRCQSCFGKFNSQRITGKNNPCYRHGKMLEKRRCVDCGVQLSKWAAIQDNKRCNRCAKKLWRPSVLTREKMSLAVRKEKNPNWRGGISKAPYPFEFDKKLKAKIFKRDFYTCQLCYDYPCNKLTVHHIDYNKMNLSELNLVILCRACNSRVNFRREMWSKYFTEEVMKAKVQK